MSVEELIAELQKMPQSYQLVAFQGGCIEDFEAEVCSVECDSTHKEVLIHIDPS